MTAKSVLSYGLLLLIAAMAILLAVNVFIPPTPRLVRLDAAPPADITLGQEAPFTLTVDVPLQADPAAQPQARFHTAGAATDSEPPALQLTGPRLRHSALSLRGRRWQLTLGLQGLTPGTHPIPEIQLPIRTEQGETLLTIPSGDQRITVRSVLDGDQPDLTLAPADIQPPPAPEPSPIGLILIGSLFVLLVLAAIVHLLRRRRPGELPAAEIARLELNAIEADLPLPADAFYTRLTDTVRRYLERRFALAAAEQPTPEFLESLRRPDSPIRPEVRQEIAALLEAADRVKFARATADPTTMTTALTAARALLTLPDPDPTPKGE